MRTLPGLRMRALFLTLLLLATLLPLAPTSEAHFCAADDAVTHATCLPACLAHAFLGDPCRVECLTCRVLADALADARELLP